MDRGEVLVAAHRLRRVARGHPDVLAVTEWVIGGGGQVEEESGKWEAEARALQALLFERDAEIGQLRANIDELLAAAGRGDCNNCAEKEAELEQVKAALRLQNKRNDDLYWEVEKLKAQVVVAGGGECPQCAERRAIDAARQRRKRERRQAKEATSDGAGG